MTYDQSHLATMATKASTTSVMNPTLMLCLIICPLALIGSVSLYQFHQPIPASVVLLVGIAPLAIACWQLIHFTKAEPWRLQREQHNENMLAIRNRIEVKEGDDIKQFPISSPLTGNPQITDKSGE
ncbi:hypothetical protein [Sphingomonas sp. PP-CC-3G-468]|uniref:hypothetical protein n=1 Tax=Sphingomonas sp. PP-CC-3G-468 TaxID=2135656 RepID=UPI00104F3807|nr:hypothetical protein [Sphingomonas sp. PP-CC-3G-468]TCM08317.1 hypothetical protein C8J41_102281 [Sphingomonas sp. PP-CC-3G-468]